MKKNSNRPAPDVWLATSPREYAVYTVLLEEKLRTIVEQARRSFANEEYREVSSGAVWNEDEPGKYAADLNTDAGLVKLRGASLPSDNIAGSALGPRALDPAVAHDGDGDRSSTADLWQRLRSVDGTAEDKVQSLVQLIAEDDEGIAGFVVTELGRKPLPDEWLEPLLYATEQIQFEDPSERAALKDCLHEHALSLLQSGRVRSESALWAAIRRYASIVPEDEVALLQPFFGERASVATRQVALQAVQTIFHAAAPRDADSLSALRDRICDLAEKTVDPDLLVSPEIASLALNAFLALAAVGDSRAVRLATRLKATGKGWLLRRSIQTLDRMLAARLAGPGSGEKQSDANQVPAACLSELRAVS